MVWWAVSEKQADLGLKGGCKWLCGVSSRGISLYTRHHYDKYHNLAFANTVFIKRRRDGDVFRHRAGADLGIARL